MIFFDPETGRAWFAIHESRAKRGYWVEGEPRPGVSEEDPLRYQRHTMQELIDAGAAHDHGYRMPDAAREVYEEKRKAIAAAGDRGAAADVGIQAGVTRHTLLGRKREYKRMAYYSMRDEIESALEAAGVSDADIDHYLNAWDDDQTIRIEQDTDDGNVRYRLYDETNRQIGREYDLDELNEIATAGSDLEGAFSEYKDRREIADELVAQIESAGLRVQDLGFAPADVAGMLDEVREAFSERSAILSERDEYEAVDLDELEDLPF